MVCDILDFQCIFVNELIGNVVLASILGAILYFIVAGKSRFGFDLTIALLVPILLMMGLYFTGFSIIYAFSAVVVGLMLYWVYIRIIGNR